MIAPISDYYEQDVIAPATICHGYDFGDPDRHSEGTFAYEHNFLDYYFVEDGIQLVARYYFDRTSQIVVLVNDAIGLVDIFLDRVLLFLSLRFDNITIDGDDLTPEVRLRLDQVKAAHKQTVALR